VGRNGLANVKHNASIYTAHRRKASYQSNKPSSGWKNLVTLFHDLLLRSYLYHCDWSVITAHNLTPEKRINN